jgi:hypothetical protein
MDINAIQNQTSKLKTKGFFARLFKPLSMKVNSETAVNHHTDEESEILECLRSAREEWMDANRNFKYADDEEMIDYFTYKIKASEVRYEFYLKKAKEKGIKVNQIEKSLALLKTGTANE